MIALLKKDWRINRVPAMASLVMLLTVHGLVLSVLLWNRQDMWDSKHVRDAISDSATLLMWISSIVAACYGGTAFAAERRERSADFLAMMPTTRARIVLSKTIVGLAGGFALWLLNLGVIIATGEFAKQSFENMSTLVLCTGGLHLMCFGVAWFLSTLIESTAIAAAVAMGATIAFIMAIGLYAANHHFTAERVWAGVAWCTLCTGVVSYIAGTVYYMQRVEP